MDLNIKAQWVAALRSGEYQQGKNVLHNVDDNTYCCLGVLCDLAVKAGVHLDTEQAYNNTAAGDITVYGAEGDRHAKGGVTLPDEVTAWAGLDDDNPVVEAEGGTCTCCPVSLAEVNDNGAMFEDIARLIEDQL